MTHILKTGYALHVIHSAQYFPLHCYLMILTAL
jgi:hypothetical protein